MNEVKGIFRLSRASLGGISIEEVADVWRGNNLEDHANVGSKDRISQIEIRNFIVDVSIKDDDVAMKAGAGCNTPPDSERINKVESHTETGHLPRTHILVTPIDRRRRGSDSSFS